jgi:protocatechuate 3,4-dioxygenase beta subunit
VLAIFCSFVLAPAAQERRATTKPTPAGFQIGGMVVDASNHQPLGQAQVTVTLATDSQYTRTVTTGADGRFRFDRLKAGKYALSAERRGFARQGYEEHEGQFSTAIVVGSDVEPADLVFRLAPDASFSGRVTDEGGESVRHARVLLIAEELRDGVRARRIVRESGTDDQGYYHIGHLRPGAYCVAVSARPWYAQAGTSPWLHAGESGRTATFDAPRNPALDVAYPLTFYPEATDAAAAMPITVHAGDHASADILLRAVPALHLRINDRASGKAEGAERLVNAELIQNIFDSIEIPVQSSVQHVRPNTAVITGIAPGHYLLRLDATPRRFGPRQPFADADQSRPMRVRELDLAGDTELDANETVPATAVSGTVKLADGQNLPKRMMIELRSRAGHSLLAPTNIAGEFAFPRGAPAGNYEVVMSSGEGVFIRSVTATGAKITGRMLQISGSDAVTLAITAGAGIARIEGVAQREGKPQSGAMILLVPRDPANNLPLFRRDQSDSDGTFTLIAVLPGRYTLLALENGWELEWSKPELLKPFLAGGTSAVVEPKGKHKVRVNVQEVSIRELP